VAKTTSGFNSDRTIQQYAHGLLLQSPFIPFSTDYWSVRAKTRQNGRLAGRRGKTGSRNMAATPKSTFWPWFPIHFFRQFLAMTYRFATIQKRDRQTDDRQTTQCAKGSTDSTVGQKRHKVIE